jgi:hypothetical protein
MKKIITHSELFEKLLENPNIYLSHGSISLLCAFIDGYGDRTVRDDLYSQFNFWIAAKFNIKSAHNWETIITFIGVSEQKAFELTKQLWAEYKTDETKLDTRPTVSFPDKPNALTQPSELLQKIFERPVLFLGNESVPKMKAFIDGYIFAHFILGVEINDSLYDGFQKYVSSHFRFEDTKSWASIISFMGLSETGSFRLAKELWLEYKSENLKLET